jgi:hypothetical protein
MNNKQKSIALYNPYSKVDADILFSSLLGLVYPSRKNSVSCK